MATTTKPAGGAPGTTPPLMHSLAAVLEALPGVEAERVAARLIDAVCMHITSAPLGQLDPRLVFALDLRDEHTLCRCEFCGANAEDAESDLDEAMEAGDEELADHRAELMARASDRATRLRYLGLKRAGVSPCQALILARHPERGGDHVGLVAAEVIERVRHGRREVVRG